MNMIYDELLAKIDTSLQYGIDFGYIDPEVGWEALRAVVELHKPTNGDDRNICLACSAGFPIAYPCPTIQAIERQLG